MSPLSLYGSYSLTYLPRAGEQLSSLSLTNQALDPEEFRNYEVGAKWDVVPSFSFTAALYRLDRGNVIVPDPDDPARSILVDAQRTKGLELGLNGNITRAWSMAGGYAYQDGEITRSISATAQAGAALAQLPKHSISLWNKYDVTPRLAAALGVIYRSDVFTSTDNLVVLPSWTRVDAAVYYNLTSTLRAQVNIENLFDEDYYLNAHSNTNITPGSPRADSSRADHAVLKSDTKPDQFQFPTSNSQAGPIGELGVGDWELTSLFRQASASVNRRILPTIEATVCRKPYWRAA